MKTFYKLTGFILFLFIFTLSVSPKVFGQFEWQKYEGNPVIIPDTPWEEIDVLVRAGRPLA